MFSLRGPDFLVLYVGLAAVVFVIVHIMIGAREALLASNPRIRDPYAIAYLRGDARELIRVVALSLCLRGLLTLQKTTMQTVSAAEIDRVQVPVEKVLLRVCRVPNQPAALLQIPDFKAAVDEYQRDLARRGLLADDTVRRQRWRLALLGGAFLLLVALIKIKVALATGHHNIFFLILLTALALFVLGRRVMVRRTSAGSEALLKLATLFAALRKRRAPASSDGVSEAALLAAVFGIYSVAGLDSISWARMFPSSNNSNTGSSGTSSCGGGGSGCGGGGGGGGGCGGCGS